MKIHQTFSEHLNVETKDWEPPDKHHQLEPDEKHDNPSNMVVPTFDRSILEIVALWVLKYSSIDR